MVRVYLQVKRCSLKKRREWRKFKNNARSDSLELGHWVKATDVSNAGTLLKYLLYDIAQRAIEYKFAKYNIQPTVYEWSQDEYVRHLEGMLLSESGSHVLILL